MRILHTLCLFLVALFLSIGTVKADSKPNPPREFSATSEQIFGTTKFNVYLKWYYSAYDDSSKKAVGYHIYMANGQTEDESQFQLVATVVDGDSAGWFYKTIGQLSAGTYTFYIKAYNNSGESNRTGIKVFTLTVKNTETALRFTTTPGKTVNRGGTYHYESHVVCSDSSKNSHIRYKIINGPDGMTIDSITGEITWTAPNTDKVVEVKIMAYLDNDDSVKVYQSWTITVGEGNNNNGEGCAWFVGNVRDTSNNPMNGTVKIYRVDSTGQLMDGVYTVTLVNGHWSRRVPPGTYVIRTQGEGFEYEWYNNAKEPSQAEHFTVDCNDTNEVNFEVIPAAQEQKYVFAGRVVDSQSGNGVKATVYFYPLVNGALGSPITVQTNADGYYEVKVSSRYSYVAKAAAGDDFVALWFENAASQTTATVLPATANRTGINFSLPRRQNYNNGFAGQLIDSAGNGVRGTVIAYLVKTNNNNEKNIQRMRSVETDSTGHWTMNNMTPGEYVLQGVPAAHPPVAGYYKQNEFAVFKWASSTSLNLDSTTHTTGLVIKLRPAEGRRGIIKLKGRVDGDGGIIDNNGHHIQGPAPLAGALITVLDNSNVPVDFTFSAADGSYELNELALGANTIIIDKPGYFYLSQNLNFNGANNVFTVTNNVVLEALVAGVVEEAANNAVLSPNPTSAAINVRFESAAGLAQVSIVNSLGMEVYRGSQNLVNGQNSIVLGTSELANGSYFVHISLGNSRSTLKFSVVH